MAYPRFRRILCLAALSAMWVSAAWADRPSAPALLPEDTLAVVRFADVPELKERLKATALGKATQDPEIAPLVSKLYASAGELWRDIEERVGLPLDQLLSIPQGEICLAVIPQGERAPAIVALIDVKDRLASATRLIEKGEQAMIDQGGSKATEIVGDVRCTVYSGANGRRRLVQFEKEGTIVFASTLEAAKTIIESWAGDGKKHLADNDRFAAVMNRCKGAKDDPPQFTWYFDPISTIRIVARGNAGGQTFLALLPVIGLDGIQALGGSIVFDSGEFDTIGHFHVLMSSPRSGVLELITLGAGDTTPEPWVPGDAVSYLTVHWNLNDMYRRGAKIYNSLTSEGAFEGEVKERISKALEVDFETELLPAISGRVSLFGWVEKPYRLNSQTATIGVRLTDAKAFEPTLQKLLAKLPEGTEKGAFGGVSYHRIKVRERTRPENAPPQELLRQPSPCVAIVGDYLLISDSEEGFHHAIAAQSDPEKGLAAQLDYKLIAGKLRRQNGGERPGMISFNRPEEGLRAIYEMARSDAAKGQLQRMTDGGNRYIGVVKAALDDHPLPPFSVLEKYFAPGGSIVTNEESGFHWMTFQLKRK